MGQKTKSAGRPRRSNVRGENTRARLIDAALESFSTRSFHGTGTRDIAEAAGMSQAAMYVHYPTKEDLLYQISYDGHLEIEGVVLDAVARGSSPKEQLAEVMYDFTVWHARSHTRARVINYELGGLTPEHREEIATFRRRLEATMRRILVAGVEEGGFLVPDPSMTALALLSLGIDVSRWYRDNGRWTPEDIGERYRYLALRIALGLPQK
ncbi:TetR/AcrR family transcriptional regulator [Nonomuraea harbinensis]|uniref:TetR/AcrR family transcriptional regulator n=1 Tax=Nonomuraea harbinensis TaxID=1286938 RepID=A0ABW1C575_9ACTN|nr:TetR/AcrR family transcriptional regulator [Nonomuraea harbinensis]